MDEIMDNDYDNIGRIGEEVFFLNIIGTIPRLRMYMNRPNLMYELTNRQFRDRFRFSKETVNSLCEIFDPYLRPLTNNSQALSTCMQVLIALRFLATGCYQMTVGDIFQCHKSTISRQLPNILSVIASLGRRGAIKMPDSNQEIRSVMADFYSIANFPRIIGCIDCTHVRIQCPDRTIGERFRNRKSYFSINVQCVGGPNLKIFDIVARWGGSVHDQTILDNSQLLAKLERNDYGGGIILGDGGYGVKRFLLTPLTNPQTLKEKAYQKAQIKTRNSVERLFGVLKRRFPTLSLGFRVKIKTILTAIVACAVLHNLAIDLNDSADDFPPVEDLNIIEYTEEDLLEIDRHPNNFSTVRNIFIEKYF